VLADFKDRNDVGMIQIRGGFGLGEKAFDVRVGRELAPENHLERDDAVEA